MVTGRRTRASSRLVFLLLVLVVDHNSLDFIVVLGLGWSQMYLLCVLSKGYMHTGNDGAIDANKHGGDDDTVICVKIFVAVLFLLVFLLNLVEVSTLNSTCWTDGRKKSILTMMACRLSTIKFLFSYHYAPS